MPSPYIETEPQRITNPRPGTTSNFTYFQEIGPSIIPIHADLLWESD